MTKAARKSHNTTALTRYLAAHPTGTEAGLASLVLAVLAAESPQPEQGGQYARAAQTHLPQLADYAAYYEAKSASPDRELGPLLKAVFEAKPSSPLLARSVLLRARALIAQQKPAEAQLLLKRYFTQLPDPQGDALLAQAAMAAGQQSLAATYYQRVYFLSPTSQEAGEAGVALVALKVQLGAAYPTPASELLLARPVRLQRAGRAKEAKADLLLALAVLSGTDRDLARVRIGAAELAAKENSAAFQTLSNFAVTGEPEAERLYHLTAAARRLERDADVSNSLQDLARRFPHSPWRMEALAATASAYLVRNDATRFEPLYRACATDFGTQPLAAACHWRLSWSQYVQRASSAENMLHEHLRRFPSSEKGGAALYFLGRLAEQANRSSSARAYYDEAIRRYPNSYYSVISAERTRAAGLLAARADAETVAHLEELHRDEHGRTLNFIPNAATAARAERVLLLTTAGLDDLAEAELRYSATHDGQTHVAALELAKLAQQRGAPDQGIRFVKRYAPGYLNLSLSTAPEAFWRLAFPLPYRQELEDAAQERGLDPFVLAALIRQESEFDTRAVSRVRALGLTQVMPATGKQLSRTIGIRWLGDSTLFDPAANLKLGTYYLRSLLTRWQDRWERVLAAYNAGPTRAALWSTWADYREPAEFIENIPFTETRDYVQAVLRNAAIYRHLYGTPVGQVPSTNGATRDNAARRR